MNYSFLEPLSDFAFITRSIPQVEPVPVELDESWKKFEKELGGFKTQYAKARAAVTISHSRLSAKYADVNVLEIASKVLKSADLKSNLSTVIEHFQTAEGIPELTKEYGEALGRVEAMKQIMCDTNAERYARFTCFVCMEHLVDCLLDPCNHVMCEVCWAKTRSTQCPGCRTEVREVRKIFTLS
jgi:hypothetical protein